jgi:polar amino acid transport system substrate-binding protein
MLTHRNTWRRWRGVRVACVSMAAWAGLSVSSVAVADDQPLPSDPQCTIQSFVGADRHVSNRVYEELAPTGILRVGVNYGNPNNATRDRAGLLHGVAIDLACVLARRLGVEVQFIGYPGVGSMMQGFDNDEWTVGFSFSPELSGPTFAYAHPHIGVENTYLVPGDSPIQTTTDADRPGVRISVARDNSPDIFLTEHLQFAQLVRFDTVPEALAALRDGAVDAFAGSRSAELAFLPQMPGGRILPDTFLIANLAQVLRPGLNRGLRYLDRFVEEAKISFLLQFAVCRAGLIGVSVPPPLVRQRDGF